MTPILEGWLMRHLSCSLFVGAALVGALHGLERADRKNANITTEELRSMLEKARGKHNVPALAAAISREGDKPRAAVVGVRKRGTDILVAVDDQWHIGSNTKPITALLIALLIDLGLLDWDTPLAEIF